jgi:very-short-patch-repair endonuclease
MQNITDFCRHLRKQQTVAEQILWSNLLNRGLFEQKFLRQHPICVSAFGYNRYYIPDFYCHSAKLVIEADGPIHLLKQDYDKNRDEVLSELGLRIIRFTNDQILNDTQSVLDVIRQQLVV